MGPIVRPEILTVRASAFAGLLAILFGLVSVPPDGPSLCAQETTTVEHDQTASRVPPGRTVYLGRRIADTMHFTGAEWLIRNDREREERCSLMLSKLGIKPGMVVCDMGCGNGFYSLLMAKVVGKNGRILAVDIQPEMLAFLRQRAEQQGLENISPILGSLHDPRVPEKSSDLILMVDVYHEFSHPVRMLAAARRSLKAGGRLVLVEYRAEDPDVPIRPLHKMSRKQILRELNANGFQLVQEFDGLPWQHMMFFASDDRAEQDKQSSQ